MGALSQGVLIAMLDWSGVDRGCSVYLEVVMSAGTTKMRILLAAIFSILASSSAYASNVETDSCYGFIATGFDSKKHFVFVDDPNPPSGRVCFFKSVEQGKEPLALGCNLDKPCLVHAIGYTSGKDFEITKVLSAEVWPPKEGVRSGFCAGVIKHGAFHPEVLLIGDIQKRDLTQPDSVGNCTVDNDSEFAKTLLTVCPLNSICVIQGQFRSDSYDVSHQLDALWDLESISREPVPEIWTGR